MSLILVVDDNPDILEVMTDFLESLDHTVITAPDGDQGYHTAIEKLPDLIILDIDMPGRSGLEVCRDLRKTPETEFTPIIILTGLNDDDTLMEGLEAGCDDFLNKPPNIPVLIARVQSLLSLSHHRNEIVEVNANLDEKIKLLQESQSQLEKALSDKEDLLKELYHRTKNNMQSITSLLNLQMYQSNNPELEQAFKVTQDRIRSMSLVHQKLYQSKSLDSISMDEYFSELAQELCYSYSNSTDSVKLDIECDPIQITLEKAIPIGLIVNELLTNAFKYAFPDHSGGKISLIVKDLGGQEVQITVEDDGPGLPAGFTPTTGDSLGFKLVRSIAEDQLMGTLDFPKREKGLAVSIRISL